MEKDRLVRFVAKVMEESGFKVYKDFKTSRYIIDIYGVLPTIMGDMGVVVACKNYDESWKVGLDVLKEMEMITRTLKASKIVIIATSYFTDSALNYAGRRNIKLIDKKGLVTMAKKFSKKESEAYEKVVIDDQKVAETFLPSTKSSEGPSIFHTGKRNLSRSAKSKSLGNGVNLENLMPGFRSIMNSTIALIFIVLILSSFITYIISLFNKKTALIGVSKIISSTILSYSLVFFTDRNPNVFLTKGTIVFFVSMIIYVILILLL